MKNNDWERTCSKCKETKPISEYYKKSSGKDGFNSFCKTCYRAYDRKRYYKDTEKRLERQRTPEVRARKSKYSNVMNKKYPERMKARQMLRNAVTQGKIVKPNYCRYEPDNLVHQADKLEAHHYLGYEGEHWKDVQWLCKKHHMILHRRYGNG